MARGLGDPNRLLHERRQSLDVLDQRLDRALQTAVRNQRNKLETLSAKVRHPREKVQRMADLAESLSQRLLASSQARVAGLDRTYQAQRFGKRLLNGATRSLDQNKQVLSNAQRLLDSFANSRDRLLEQGYVWISDAEGSVVPRAANVTEGMGLKVHFLDGAVDVVAGAGAPPAKAPKAAPRPKKPGKEEDSQGSLL